ncbi:hypothetical protein F4860DRAFT_233207 [Xylaria cubensis]|nr:hypothetical protein F4860DRAFT_233207 [Xylaria cubensis]
MGFLVSSVLGIQVTVPRWFAILRRDAFSRTTRQAVFAFGNMARGGACVLIYIWGIEFGTSMS